MLRIIKDHQAEAKPKPQLNIEDTDAWLAKHGNGMDRLPKKEKFSPDAIWSEYGNHPVPTLIWRCLNKNGEIVPADISNSACQRAVQGQLRKMVANGELNEFYVERHTDNPMRADKGGNQKVKDYRLA